MLKKYIGIVVFFVFALHLFSCSEKKGTNTQGGKMVEGGAITLGISSDLDAQLDPHTASSASVREIFFNIFEGLVKPDTSGALQPALAESYTVNSTADEYTFVLRKGVHFHNGKELTVQDAIYSIRRAAGLDTGTPLVSNYANILSCEALDENRIVIKLKAPNTEFITAATTAIIPDGNDPAKEVIGTGPYAYVSRLIQDTIILKKHTSYWGKPAHIDTITLKVIEDAETMVMALRSGVVDIAAHMLSGQAEELHDLTIAEGYSNIVQALYLNNAFAPFSDMRVRQALSYATNKHEVIALASSGYGKAVGSNVYPSFGKYYLEDLTNYYEHNIEKAKALLTEAGYPSGFEFTITVPSTYPIHVDTAQVLVEQYKAIGVRIKINQVEWTTWLSDVYRGRNYEATVVGLDSHTLAASGLLERFVSGNSKNFINFSSAAYDAAYNTAINTVDDAKQTEYFKQCERILTEEAASIYIQDPSSFAIMQKNIAGFVYYPLYVLDFAALYKLE